MFSSTCLPSSRLSRLKKWFRIQSWRAFEESNALGWKKPCVLYPHRWNIALKPRLKFLQKTERFGDASGNYCGTVASLQKLIKCPALDMEPATSSLTSSAQLGLRENFTRQREPDSITVRQPWSGEKSKELKSDCWDGEYKWSREKEPLGPEESNELVVRAVSSGTAFAHDEHVQRSCSSHSRLVLRIHIWATAYPPSRSFIVL